MTPEARLMIHSGQFHGLPEIITQNEIRSMGDEAEFSANRYARILAGRTAVTFEQLKDLCAQNGDVFFSAHEALMAGFIDVIDRYEEVVVLDEKNKKKTPKRKKK
jgi:ATP-dependent protease ClpP protease subunit